MRKKAATVLLIDDSPEDRDIYKAYLGEQSDCLYTFLEADDGEEGLRICRQAQVDLILLDFELPDLNGLDVLERLREEEEGIPIPVVMMTGRGSEEVAVQALKAGALDYLVKAGVTSTSLYRATRNALERAELAAQLSKETTDREEAEDELRESEARFRLLVESVKDYAIVMLDLEGRITSWNAGARAMFGYHDKEVLGHHYRRLFTPEDVRAKVAERELLEAEAHQRTYEERWHVRKDGSRLWTVGHVFPVIDGAGIRRGYSKVLRDITDRRNTLMQLQEALQARDEFLAVASHELKTPVTSLTLKVQGLLRVMEKSQGARPDAVQVRERLADMNAQLERLRALIENLLDSSALASRRVVLQPQQVELGALVHELLELRADQLGPGRELIHVEAKAAVWGSWDRLRLQQVVLGLLLNAVRHAPGQPIHVCIESHGRMARLSVADRGPGISRADQRRIFERFERVAAAPDGSGLGLGLFIARHVIQAFGGSIGVESEPGHGATFTIDLPLGDQLDAEASHSRM